MGQLFKPEVRKWIYGVSLAVIPLLIAFGVVRSEDAPLWIALAGAVLNSGLAVANVDTSK